MAASIGWPVLGKVFRLSDANLLKRTGTTSSTRATQPCYLQKKNSSSLWDVCCNEWQQELRTARENAARKREELQHLNQVLCEDVSDVSDVTIHMSHTRRHDMPPYATVGLIWFDRLHTSLQGWFPRPCRCRSNFSKKWMQREGCECCPFFNDIKK